MRRFDFLYDVGEERDMESYEVADNIAVPRAGEKVVLKPIEDQGYDEEWEIHEITHFPLESRILFWIRRS